MQHVKGRLSSLGDLLIFLDRLKESGGRLELYLPYYNEEIVICFSGTSFFIDGTSTDFLGRKALQVFLEKWLLGGVPPEFEFFEGEEECSSGTAVPEEELFKVVRDPFLEKIKEFPQFFKIENIDVKRVPSFLVAHRTTGRPVSREEVYRYGLTLSDILKYIEVGLISIKPYAVMESFPYRLRLFVQALALLVVIYFSLPLGYLKFNVFKLSEAINWGLRDRILNGGEREELPVKGCLKTRFYLIDNIVVNPGLDGIIGTSDDLSAPLPARGYIPTFALPVK